MELSTIIPHIEALVFASEKPLTTLELVDHVNNALGFIEDRASLDQVESAIEAIKEKYSSEFYPFELKESGGGLQFLTKPVYHKTVATLNGDKFLKRLSTAALETLSIIAYKQPITKGEIENIRGVNCDYAVQKLLEKDLVVISGRKENAPGQPLIYATSKSFMDYFGINSADELPKLSDIMPQDITASTTVSQSNPVDSDAREDDEEGNLVVNEEGNIEEMPGNEDNEANLFIQHVADKAVQEDEPFQESAFDEAEPTAETATEQEQTKAGDAEEFIETTEDSMDPDTSESVEEEIGEDEIIEEEMDERAPDENAENPAEPEDEKRENEGI